MDEIYTNLSILYEMAKPCAPIKIPLNSHHEIFTRHVNGMLPKRILVLGRGGSGKSTLLAKIAYDWATENSESPLKDLPLLFVLNMRWMQYTSSLEEAILHQLLPTDTKLSKESIRDFLEHNPDSVMILLDSYDEFSRGDILGSNQTDGGNVVNTLANMYLTSCRVLVSSRHWRASDFSSLHNVYAKVEVEGFSENHVREYIMKTFQESPDSGERLCDYIKTITSVQLVCSVILPTLQKVLEDWHQRSQRNLGTCTQSCPNKGKPNPKKGFCQSCVSWGAAIEQAYFPQSNIVSMKWNNIDPTLFCKDPIEVAKMFVLRLPRGQIYGCLDNFDVASLLMLAIHFTPYHQGNQAFYDKLQKVFKVRNELCHLNIENSMELDDIVTAQYFDDIHDLIPCLAPRYYTQDIVDQIQLDISKIQTSTVSARMKQLALSPLREAAKEMVLELIIDEKLKLQEGNTKEIPGHAENTLNSRHETFTRQVNGMLPTRILVLGRGGSGKSTLLAQIAYDWATENADSPLKDLPLLFVLNMRWMQYTSSLEEAILHQLLPKDTKLSKESIRFFLEQNPDSVMILLDSYDEFSRGEIIGSNQTDGGNVVDTLANRYLTSCRVLVSSRHWRASDFSVLNNIYAKIEVEGFSEESVRKYIMKTFKESPDSGNRLWDYINNNNLIQIASIPLMAQLFCLFWNEANEEDIPNKINDLYTSIFRILHNHFLAKKKNINTTLSLLSHEDVIVRLGECACLGLWPPQNKLVFPYEEVKELTSAACVEDGCKIGIISIEKMTSTYKSIHRSEIYEQKSVVFFHKSAQEKCGGEYLSHLADKNPDELRSKLQKLDSAKKCLSVQMVLRFACGSSLKAAKLILEKLVEIMRLELIVDVRAYYANTLRDPEKAKLVQEFIETCLLCNYESGSTGQFNQLLAEVFPTGKLQFLGLSPYTSAAIAHFLSNLEGQRVITKIKLVQIPIPGICTRYGKTTAIVDEMSNTVQGIVNLIPTYNQIENVYKQYVEGHQNTSNLENFTKAVGSDAVVGLLMIELWEYFKTWHTSESQINTDPILDTVKFTKLDELDLTDIKLKDSGQKLLTVIKQGHLNHLTQLILSDTGLSAEVMNGMVLCLPQCIPSLQVLDTSYNDTESQVILNLTKTLPDLSLHDLKVDDMWASANNMTALAQVMPQICTNLTVLRMKGNYMDDGTGKTLVSTLPYARRLKVLWIDVAGMSKKIHRKLAMTMGKLVLLEWLEVYRSHYVDDLMLCMGKIITSLSNLDQLTLGASYADDNTDVSSTQSRLLRFLTRIEKSQNKACASTIPIMNRSSWQSFMSSLQPMAAQMQRLYLLDVNLHEADLRDLVTLCREHNMKLGYTRRMWPVGVDIPRDIALQLM
ncbi:NLR family CARD domain-containing protein 4-like [Amphiura filiformis]|uniref:NLR family CARD domain-containing protein 4-like n=1 Tax=Amphiura filiformis TaxID=82378 RepID=UPI003B2270CD